MLNSVLAGAQRGLKKKKEVIHKTEHPRRLCDPMVREELLAFLSHRESNTEACYFVVPGKQRFFFLSGNSLTCSTWRGENCTLSEETD